MNVLNITVSHKLYQKNPEKMDLESASLKSIELMEQMGYEQLTFKKIAIAIESTDEVFAIISRTSISYWRT